MSFDPRRAERPPVHALGGHCQPFWVTTVLHQDGSLAAWRAAHNHHLHSAEVMLTCLRQHFANVDVTVVPYLYRYICAVLEESTKGYRLASCILELEKRFAASVPVPLIGRHYVEWHKGDTQE